jgi:hypothetical protein
MFNSNTEGHLVVFAQHDNCSKEFLFAVPWYLEVHKGDVLLVETMYGDAIATATSEMFEGKDIDEVATKFGAYLPLKKVKEVAGIKIRANLRQKLFEELKTKLLRTVLEVVSHV